MASLLRGAAKSLSFSARLAAAALDGVTFTLGSTGRKAILAAEVAAYAAETGGAARPLLVAAQAALACTAARTVWVLGRSLRNIEEQARAEEQLRSIWDWAPEEGADSLQSWHVLRSLVRTAYQIQDDYPVLTKLLAQPALSGSELATRLYCLYAAHGQEFGAGEPPLGADAAPPPLSLLRQLVYYRPFAGELSYDRRSDRALSQELQARGFSLICAAHEPNLDLSSPAYYLALSTERKEVLLAVRGTSTPEDVFSDLLGTGAPLDLARGVHGHSGMTQGALFLGRKFQALLRLLAAQGLRITLVGHSLGAGVAALLAVYLRAELGLDSRQLRCWAFETPACMDLNDARACADIVVSLVHADDVVPRLCAETFAGLLEELARPEHELTLEDVPGAQQVVQHLNDLLSWDPASWKRGLTGSSTPEGQQQQQAGSSGRTASSGRGEKDMAQQNVAEASLHRTADELREREEESMQRSQPAKEITDREERVRVSPKDFSSKEYHPHIPGQVVFMHRLRPVTASSSGDSASSSSASGRDAGIRAGSSSGASPAADSAAAAAADSEGKLGFAVLDNRHPVLRRIRLTSNMVSDHSADAPEFIAALEQAVAAQAATVK